MKFALALDLCRQFREFPGSGTVITLMAIDGGDEPLGNAVRFNDLPLAVQPQTWLHF